MRGEDRREMLARLRPMLPISELKQLQRLVTRVQVSESIIDYCYAILSFTRQSPRFLHGLSPRAGLGLLRSARAWALIEDRPFVIPEDVQAVLDACVPHRLVSTDDSAKSGNTDITEYILKGVPVP